MPAGLLSVKCQTLASTTASSTDSQLRLVSTVDNLQYKNVGFDIQMGKKVFHYESEKVCKKISASENSQVEFDYTPQAFHNMAKYFTTVTIINITTEEFNTGIFINPFWTTLDGTKVYGVSQYATVEDSYLNIVNVPVRLYSNEKVAAGYLEVEYDKGRFKYLGADGGTMFEEMEVAERNGRIHCIGNVEAISSDKAADGMYVNLKFRNLNLDNTKDAVFNVLNADFCDNKEDTKNFKFFDVMYKQIVKSASNQ